MVGLALITTLPLSLFSIVIVGELRQGELEGLQQRAGQEAETLARMVDRQFHDMVTTLLVLETSPELRDGNLGGFHLRANAALARSGWYLLIVDRDGQQFLNTRVPFGQPLAKTSNMAALNEAIATNRPVISNTFFGRTGNTYVYNVMKTVELPDRQPGDLTLILTQNADDLDRLIGDRSLPPDWHYALLDPLGVVVASDTEMPAGELFPAESLALAKAMQADPNHAPESAQTMSYTRVGLTNWQVVVWGPSSSGIGSVGSTWRILILAGIGFFALSLVCAMLFGRKLEQAIRAISERAQGVGRGEIVSPIATGIRELDQVSYALSEASFDRNQAEERLQVVLREMAHRTKNVILVVQSLVRQTARHSDDKNDFVTAITGRLGSFARSLELLMTEGMGSLSFTRVVTSQLDTFIEAGDRLTVQGEDFPVSSGALKEIGMIVHELATNAMKYGALSTSDGHVEVHWVRFETDGKPWLRLTWREHGGPKPEEPEQKGFGSVLIQTTLQSLHGTAQCDYLPEGIRWVIDMPEAMVREQAE